VLVGELAHNVGATATGGSPRGLAEDIADREAEQNLLLLCHACHRLIDNEDHAPYFTTEQLRALKKKHEDRIWTAATSGGMRRTAALRVGGLVRGATALASQRQTADALLGPGGIDEHLGKITGPESGHTSNRETWSDTDEIRQLTAVSTPLAR
jgi:hypothetical protein